ncbi:hypothetical protein E4U24_004192 [Claviceps purpurea]|nr:hypothetical protein E4U28_001639 [Claviceps purpurea]KAG6172345.1 hypothetical protein E4U11_004952 [Claviceps purpurea]KAG6178589.1 hypothetical protein E4U27_003650 [Claviceps purpurea]KAG6201155.1 hypothetical protein E4U10_000410 [Claviceps purpurea]KAG6230744.1 hypothetical protein E4U26_007673 [Claviceps purpurea]
MKFLCLHGAFGNASNFQAQLGPFVSKAKESGDQISFKWISGRHEAIPPAGFSDYFGRGPLYRFIPFDGIEALDDVLHKLDEFPQGETAEDTIRQLIQSDYGSQYTLDGVRTSIEYILDAVREDPEIEGILGFSEGATAAASAILEEKRLWEEEGVPRQLKCGIFFAGWPPLSLKGGQCNVILADESEDAIDIPTCHVVGSDDPYIDGAMSLHSMCDQDSAVLFDHGSGHFIPREPQTLSELTAAITAMTEQAEASFSSHSDTESISEIRKSIDGFSMLSDDCSSASSVDSGDYGDDKC